MGAFNNYVDKMRGWGSKCLIFVHAQGIKTVHAGSGSQTMAKLNAPPPHTRSYLSANDPSAIVFIDDQPLDCHCMYH